MSEANRIALGSDVSAANRIALFFAIRYHLCRQVYEPYRHIGDELCDQLALIHEQIRIHLGERAQAWT